MTRTWIAEEILLHRHPDGSSTPVRARIGIPTKTPEGAWCCRVELDGLRGRTHEVTGGGPMQALKMAMECLASWLRRLIRAGEVFACPDDPDTVWDDEFISLSFGDGDYLASRGKVLH